MNKKTENLDDYLIAYQGDNIYDFDNNLLLNWYPKRVIKALGDTTGKSLLELGLGHGITTSLFSKQFERHLVLDGSSAIINKFKKAFPNFSGELQQTYFEEFETEERFDVIIMGFVLEHVDDAVLVLNHFKRFLKPAGRIFIAVPNAEVLNRRIGHKANLLEDMTALSEHDHMLGHKRYYSVNTLTADVNKAGFKITKLEGLYLKPLTTSQMLSLNLSDDIMTALCEIGIDYPELSCGILAEIEAV